jgi:nitrous oxide reductase accessory protein NosL
VKKTLLALLVLSAFAAACHERKTAPEPRPDYGGAHSASERAHDSLDKESGGN